MKGMIQTRYVKTRIGELILGSFSEQLCLLDFRYRRMRTTVDRRLMTGLNVDYVEGESDVLRMTQHQLEEYLAGDRTEFDIPVMTVGTEFQKTVWQALQQIGYGETASYQEIANRIGRPDAVRAVAAANGANSMSVIVPCHRIIGSSGELVGYGGGLNVKKQLLALERQSSFQGGLVQSVTCHT